MSVIRNGEFPWVIVQRVHKPNVKMSLPWIEGIKFVCEHCGTETFESLPTGLHELKDFAGGFLKIHRLCPKPPEAA